MAAAAMLLLLVAAASTPSSASDIIYPSSAGVTIGHTFSTTSLAGGDTLLIRRSLVNNGEFTVSGLYFSQTIPSDFYIAGSDVTVNGQPISFAFSVSTIPPAFADCRTYHWVIDDPTGIDPVRNGIAPGESLELTIRAVCGGSGDYVFPERAAVFFAGGGGYFAVNDGPAPTVTVLPCCVTRGNVDGNELGGPVNVADLTYLVAYIFLSGPPPPCEEQANVDGSVGTGTQINIADIASLAAYLFLNAAPPPPCGP